jgi:hypothetical protein
VLGFCATQWQGWLMKNTALLLLFLAVFSRAVFGADSVDDDNFEIGASIL